MGVDQSGIGINVFTPIAELVPDNAMYIGFGE
jgi:hypothetical protein